MPDVIVQTAEPPDRVMALVPPLQMYAVLFLSVTEKVTVPVGPAPVTTAVNWTD